MKTIISAIILSTAVVFFSGCTVRTVNYTPGYNDYVYTVGYYGYRPYWGARYYPGYGWGNNYWVGNRLRYFSGPRVYRGWYWGRW